MKINHFSRLLVQNCPKEHESEPESVDKHLEVILFYIDVLKDAQRCIDLCVVVLISKDNRVVMICKQGRKGSTHHDLSFRMGEYSGFKMKELILSSVSGQLSAFVQQKEA